MLNTIATDHSCTAVNNQEIKKSYSAQTRGEMRHCIVTEVSGGQQLCLDDIIEAELTNGHHHSPRGGPVCATKQLPKALFATDL
jgi:hypothetical protein